MSSPGLRVLALMEAASLTGPAKNLLEFARLARTAEDGLPAVEVCVAGFERGSAGRETGFSKAFREAGIRLETIHERRRFDPGALRQLRALAARLRPDLIQTHNIKSHLLVRLGGFRRQMPWIAFHHGYTRKDLLDRIYNQVNRFTLPGADHVVTVCEPFAAVIRGYGMPAGKVAVRHNMIRPFEPPPPAAVRQARERFGLTEDTPVILAVGRLSREKGHSDLVEAAGLLRRSHPELRFRLALVGDGPERARLQAQLEAVGLAGQAALCGHQEEAAPFYALASVLALPSLSEGSPNVLLEAMAAGVPVAATRAGGIPEIAVHGESALTVEAGDAPALAGALARLLLEPGLARALAERARAQVLSAYTPQAYRRSMVALYRRLLAERGV